LVQRTETNVKRFMKSHIMVKDFSSIQTEENGAIRLIFAMVPLVICKAARLSQMAATDTGRRFWTRKKYVMELLESECARLD